MPYTPLDILKDLPRSNCGYCGKPGCLAFAMSVYLEGLPVSQCTQLTSEEVLKIESKLAENQSGTREKPRAVEEALTHLMEKIEQADFMAIALNSGARYRPGPPESLGLEFMGLPFEIGRQGEVRGVGEDSSVTIKVFLLIYLTRANGAATHDRWVAFRELPNTMSKSKQFEQIAEKIARTYEGKIDDLAKVVEELGGTRAPQPSTDLAAKFGVLPLVDLFLLFWDGDEDFPARCSILMDRGILDYLDQEAIVFMTEAFVALLLGESINQIEA